MHVITLNDLVAMLAAVYLYIYYFSTNNARSLYEDILDSGAINNTSLVSFSTVVDSTTSGVGSM